MKKLVAIISMLVLMLCFTGCNQQVFDTNYTFDRAYVKIGEEWKDIEIKTWGDYEGEQLQLKLQDGTVLVVHAANCILYNGKLPR
jgi:hypothetical protein